MLLLSRFSRVWLCDPIDGSLPGSSVHGVLQARTLEWVAIAFSRLLLILGCFFQRQSQSWSDVLRAGVFRLESTESWCHVPLVIRETHSKALVFLFSFQHLQFSKCNANFSYMGWDISQFFLDVASVFIFLVDCKHEEKLLVPSPVHSNWGQVSPCAKLKWNSGPEAEAGLRTQNPLMLPQLIHWKTLSYLGIIDFDSNAYSLNTKHTLFVNDSTLRTYLPLVPSVNRF